MNSTVYGVAKESGIAQSTLAAIVTGQRSISAETAFRFGLYFGRDAQFWLNLRMRCDLMLLKSLSSGIFCSAGLCRVSDAVAQNH